MPPWLVVLCGRCRYPSLHLGTFASELSNPGRPVHNTPADEEHVTSPIRQSAVRVDRAGAAQPSTAAMVPTAAAEVRSNVRDGVQQQARVVTRCSMWPCDRIMCICVLREIGVAPEQTCLTTYK